MVMESDTVILNEMLNTCHMAEDIVDSFKISTNEFIVDGITINFDSQTWDVSEGLPKGKKLSYFRFRFDTYQNQRRGTELKVYILYLFYTKGRKTENNINRLRALKPFVDFLDVYCIDNPWNMDTDTFKRYEENAYENLSITTKIKYKRMIKDYLLFLASIYEAEANDDLTEYLNKTDRKAVKSENLSGRTLLPSSEFVAALRDYCFNEVKAIYNLSGPLDVNNFNMLAAIYILSQTGIRPEEAFLLEYDCVDEQLFSSDKKVYYLNYRSTKNISNGYMYCKTLCNKNTYEVIKMVQQKFGHNEDGDLLRSYGAMSRSMSDKLRFFFHKLCIDHCKEFRLLNSKYKKCFPRNVKAKYLFPNDGYSDEDVISIPNPYQLRVYFATELRIRGLADIQISKMLNQKDMKMLGYYVRVPEQEIEDYKFSKEVIEYVSKNNYNILGQRGAERTRLIKSFFKRDNPTVVADMDEVIKKASDSMCITQKHIGFCIKGSKTRSCTHDGTTDEALCAYDMCQNQCHMFFNIDYYYDKVNESVRLIDYNLENGFVQYAQKEMHKLEYYLNNRFLPELDDLKIEVATHNRYELINKYDYLAYFIDCDQSIREEVREWIKKYNLSVKLSA